MLFRYSFAYLPEVKHVGVNVDRNALLLLLLNSLLEMANVLRIYNLDRKDTIRFIAQDPTVEGELTMSRLWLVRQGCDR